MNGCLLLRQSGVYFRCIVSVSRQICSDQSANQALAQSPHCVSFAPRAKSAPAQNRCLVLPFLCLRRAFFYLEVSRTQLITYTHRQTACTPTHTNTHTAKPPLGQAVSQMNTSQKNHLNHLDVPICTLSLRLSKQTKQVKVQKTVFATLSKSGTCDNFETMLSRYW